MQMRSTTPVSPPARFGRLRFHRFIQLRTFRRDGTPVDTPVWFARRDDRIYIVTPATSGKVKRIRNNPAVEIRVCTPWGWAFGPTMHGTARPLDRPEDEQVAAAAARAIFFKYGMPRELIAAFYRLRGPIEPLYLEITADSAC
jgi:PPOX class probable F420-dependent enzyme